MTTSMSRKRDTQKDTCWGRSLSITGIPASLPSTKLMIHIPMARELDSLSQIPQVISLSISGHLMYSASISKTLHLEVKKNFTTQTLNITAFSDFKNYTFNVTLVNKSNDDDDDDHHDDHSKTD